MTGRVPMARMHSRKRGKSSSHKIYDTGRHEWITQSDDEISDLVVQMKSGGSSKAEIGVKLRDQYAIPSTKSIVGKKISTILKEKGAESEIPEDLLDLIAKYKSVSKHIALNRNDRSNDRSRALIMTKILRLVKYYRSKGRLPEKWSLDKSL